MGTATDRGPVGTGDLISEGRINSRFTPLFNNINSLDSGNVLEDGLSADRINGTALTLEGAGSQTQANQMSFNGPVQLDNELVLDVTTLTANAVGPNVSGLTVGKTANSVGTTIVDFAGGVEGQVIIIVSTDFNTTINGSGTNIRERFGSATLVMSRGFIIGFIRKKLPASGSLIWHELFRNF